jgi:hypothetical protein
MSEMIERVAVAINDRLRERGGKPIPFHMMRHTAAAAIEAMREPTDEMVKAGVNLWCERAWDAMIDAALAGAQAGG